jgi:hypothetical protein
MAYCGIERRRAPRVEPVSERTTLSLGVSVPAEVVDMSLTGVLLASKVELSVGDRAELRATVGSRTVNVTIEVRRVMRDGKPTRSGSRHRAGAVFAPVSAEQRLALGQLLGTEPL